MCAKCLAHAQIVSRRESCRKSGTFLKCRLAPYISYFKGIFQWKFSPKIHHFPQLFFKKELLPARYKVSVLLFLIFSKFSKI